jgi:hypothetical protein
MIGAIADRSVLLCVVIVVWTRMPLIGTVDDDDHNLDLVIPWMHCYYRINRGTDYVCGGAQAGLPSSASILIGDGGLTTAVNMPPLRRAIWMRYSVCGASTL